MKLVLNDENMQEEQIIGLMKEAARLCLEREGIKAEDDTTEVSVSFVSPKEIRALNRDFRGKDEETDVLSFPQYNSIEEIREESGFLCLGDVIICPQIAAVQADEYNHSLARELVYLTVHSIYHLLGYDDMQEEERQVMREKEEAVMEMIGVRR